MRGAPRGRWFEFVFFSAAFTFHQFNQLLKSVTIPSIWLGVLSLTWEMVTAMFRYAAAAHPLSLVVQLGSFLIERLSATSSYVCCEITLCNSNSQQILDNLRDWSDLDKLRPQILD